MSIKLYDKVTLYGKKRNVYGYNQDGKYEIIGERIDYYVADANDKSQNGTGERWATDSRVVYKDGVAVRDEYGYFVYEEVPPIIHTTDNKDFKLAINMSAGGSSQGGKLSFWMCKITKTLEDGTVIDGNIGINQEELKDLLKESTFVNGVCQEPVAFYRISGNVGICTMTGKKYKQALKDKAEDESLKKAKKTTKWERGRVYKTKTLSGVWLGDVVHPFKGKVHYVEEYYKNDMDAKALVENSHSIYRGNILDKLPSRVATDIVIDCTDFATLFDTHREEELRRDIKHRLDNYKRGNGSMLTLGELTYANGLNDDLVKDYLSLLYDVTMYCRYYSYESRHRELDEISEVAEKFGLTINDIKDVDIEKLKEKYCEDM
jgi:hypothetical protein